MDVGGGLEGFELIEPPRILCAGAGGSQRSPTEPLGRIHRPTTAVERTSVKRT